MTPIIKYYGVVGACPYRSVVIPVELEAHKIEMLLSLPFHKDDAL